MTESDPRRRARSRVRLARWLPALALLWCSLALEARAVPEDTSQASTPAASVPGRALVFPADHAAHPAFRTEWWYVTGALETSAHQRIGFQVTFFRSRPDGLGVNPSRFTPRQILFAHAAISDARTGHLVHAERAARAGFGLAEASSSVCDVLVGGWSLKEAADGAFDAHVVATDFTLELHFTPRAAPMLNGQAGFSQKSPDSHDASYYYSLPQMRVAGTLNGGLKAGAVQGVAWFDHEWSSSYLNADAKGWDWVGMNLSDGGALMAFQMRDAQGAPLWSGATLREADGKVSVFNPSEVRFTAKRWWRSPRTAVNYPVEQQVQVGAHSWHVVPAMDDQELDASTSTRTLYWEGLTDLVPDHPTASPHSDPSGQGYLELTGYDHRLAF